jgi:flagellar motor switch protein FliN
MSPDEVNPTPGERPRDISEEELRNILGDDYEAVAGPPDDIAAAGPAPASAGSGPGDAGLDRPTVGGGGESSLTPGMSAQEAEAWAREMERELEQAPAGGIPPSNVQPLQFGQLDSGGSKMHGSIDLLLDVKLPISVELGRTDMLVKDILGCGPGTVIELNKLAGEPVDVFVNGRMVAQGEVVVVDEHFGVRVTNLLSPGDRIKSLG